MFDDEAIGVIEGEISLISLPRCLMALRTYLHSGLTMTETHF